MKFNWKANWEILLVLALIVVGIVITTIAAIKNKDKQLLVLPEETDFGQLLANTNINTNLNGIASSPSDPTQLQAADLANEPGGTNNNNNYPHASSSSGGPLEPETSASPASKRPPVNQAGAKHSRAPPQLPAAAAASTTSNQQQQSHNNIAVNLARGMMESGAQRLQLLNNNNNNNQQHRNYNVNLNNRNSNNNNNNRLKQAYDDSAEYNRLSQTILDNNNQLLGLVGSTSGFGTTSSLSMEPNYDTSSTESIPSQYQLSNHPHPPSHNNNNNNNNNRHHHHQHQHHQQSQQLNQINHHELNGHLNNNNNNNNNLRLYAGSKRHTNRTSLEGPIGDFENNLNSSPGSIDNTNQPINDSINDLIDDIHTTRSSLANINSNNNNNNNNNNNIPAGAQDFSGSPQSDSIQQTITQSLALHGPYGITPPISLNQFRHQKQQLNTEPTPTSSDVEETMMTSYSRLPAGNSAAGPATTLVGNNNNNLTEALLREYISTTSSTNTNSNSNSNGNGNNNSTQRNQYSSQLIGSAMLANLIASMPQSLNEEQLPVVTTPTNEPFQINQQQQQQTGSGSLQSSTQQQHTNSYRGSPYSSSLPISALLSDLIKLARPHQLINSLSGQNNNNNNNNQQERDSNRHSILQQLRSLPGPLLNLLQGLNSGSSASASGSSPSSSSSSSGNDFNNQFINHDASESSQHYQRISMSPTDIHSILTRSMRSTGVLPAFPPPKGTPQTWIPPTAGGNPSYHNALNSNADFVANNAAGFVRNSQTNAQSQVTTQNLSQNNQQQQQQQQTSVSSNAAPTNQQQYQQVANNADSYQAVRQASPSGSLYGPAGGDVYQQQAQNDLQANNNIANLYNNNNNNINPNGNADWPVSNNNNPTNSFGSPEVSSTNNQNNRYSSSMSLQQQQQQHLSNGNSQLMTGPNQNSPVYNSRPISELQVPLGYQPVGGQNIQQQRGPLEYNIAPIESSPKATVVVGASVATPTSGGAIAAKQQIGISNLQPLALLSNQQQQLKANLNQQQVAKLSRRKREVLVEGGKNKEETQIGSMGNGNNKNNNNSHQAYETRIDEDMSSKYNSKDGAEDEDEESDSRPISVVRPDGRPMNSGRIVITQMKSNSNLETKHDDADLLIEDSDSSNDRQAEQSLRKANHLELENPNNLDDDNNDDELKTTTTTNEDYYQVDQDRTIYRRKKNKSAKPNSSELIGVKFKDNTNNQGISNLNGKNKSRDKKMKKRLNFNKKNNNKIEDKYSNNNDRKKNFQQQQLGAIGLDTAGSGLMSRLLGTASTNDELEEDIDDDDESASEKRKEELDDAEFGLNNINDDRKKIRKDNNNNNENNNNHVESSRNNKKYESDQSSNTQENNNNNNNNGQLVQPEAAQYNSQRRHHSQQQRSDIEFYGHPGEETRQLKYGILGSGNYEVVNGGIYPEADESTAAVNSVANYVRKPGGLLASLPKLLAEHNQLNGEQRHHHRHHHHQTTTVGSIVENPFMPGGRLAGGYLRGASAANNQEELIGLLPANIDTNSHHHHHHETEHNSLATPLLELVDANGASQLLDANMLAQLGSSGSSAKTTHLSKEDKPNENNAADEIDNRLASNENASKGENLLIKQKNKHKNTNKAGHDDYNKRKKTIPNQLLMVDDVDQNELINLNEQENVDDEVGDGDGRLKKKLPMKGDRFNSLSIRNNNNNNKPKMQIKDSTITTTTTLGENSNKLYHGNNQFNSYQILPSKKVTIFSDQDLDSAPDEQHQTIWL